MAGRFRLVLHLGAHKTGTTAIQRWLASHKEVLAQAGIAAVTDAVAIRQAARHVRLTSADGAAGIRDLIDRAGAEEGVHTVIYSCEGHLGDAFAPGYSGLYQRRDRSLHLMADAMAGLNVEIVYSVREQADLLTSYYLQLVKQGLYITFQDYIADLDVKKLSWMPVLEEMHAAFSPSAMTVFDYSAKDAPSAAETFVHRYVPGAVVNDVRRANLSYSTRALKAAMLVLPLLKTEEEKVKFRVFVESTLCGPSEAQPKLLPESLASELQAQYQADLDAIRSTYRIVPRQRPSFLHRLHNALQFTSRSG